MSRHYIFYRLYISAFKNNENIGEEIFYVLNVIDNFRVKSNNKKQSKISDFFKI
jgi:hypothetical protein